MPFGMLPASCFEPPTHPRRKYGGVASGHCEILGAGYACHLDARLRLSSIRYRRARKSQAHTQSSRVHCDWLKSLEGGTKAKALRYGLIQHNVNGAETLLQLRAGCRGPPVASGYAHARTGRPESLIYVKGRSTSRSTF
jgi:hypothetical protein